MTSRLFKHSHTSTHHKDITIWFECQDVGAWNEKGIGLQSLDYIPLRVWKFHVNIDMSYIRLELTSCTVHQRGGNGWCLTHSQPQGFDQFIISSSYSQECLPFQDALFPTGPEGLQFVCSLSLITEQWSYSYLIRMTYCFIISQGS